MLLRQEQTVCTEECISEADHLVQKKLSSNKRYFALSDAMYPTIRAAFINNLLAIYNMSCRYNSFKKRHRGEGIWLGHVGTPLGVGN